MVEPGLWASGWALSSAPVVACHRAAARPAGAPCLRLSPTPAGVRAASEQGHLQCVVTAAERGALICSSRTHSLGGGPRDTGRMQEKIV